MMIFMPQHVTTARTYAPVQAVWPWQKDREREKKGFSSLKCQEKLPKRRLKERKRGKFLQPGTF
jgi:hypothetical protein